MDPLKIKQKFGDFYTADDNTFKMGIDIRITNIICERFKDNVVLETCTGAGFTTIPLALFAKHVYTVEINESNQKQAIINVDKAGLSAKVTFIKGDVLNYDILKNLPGIDSAFLDPDWADIEINNNYNFNHSLTKPPADVLLDAILKITPNTVLILPPFINTNELKNLPAHELQRIYLDNQHVLYCLYFGRLAKSYSITECKI